jgi:hypothetical protein
MKKILLASACIFALATPTAFAQTPQPTGGASSQGNVGPGASEGAMDRGTPHCSVFELPLNMPGLRPFFQSQTKTIPTKIATFLNLAKPAHALSLVRVISTICKLHVVRNYHGPRG